MKTIVRVFASWALLLLARSGIAAPATSTVQDTIYRGDGTRFEGLVQIQWPTFIASDGTTVAKSSTTVRISNGFLQVSLIPTTNALQSASYTVRYTSDSTGEFFEYWAIPPTETVLRLNQIRIGGPLAGEVTTPTPVAIQDVTGLRTELDLRPMRGTSWMTSRTAVIGSGGALEGAIGNGGDCVHVDGTSGPCGSLERLFIDADVPTGVMDGVNSVFGLSKAPSPAGSLSLFRNGVLLRQGIDYTVSGATVTMAPGTAPALGDTLRAWYRVADASGGPAWADHEVPTGAIDGANRTFTLAGVPMPAASLQVYRNGLLQSLGVDYTVAVNTITFIAESTPQPGDLLQVNYRK